MHIKTIEFPQSARRVYTSVKHTVEKCGQFRHVVPNDDTFVITARHGMSLLAILNLGANKKNVQSLEDYISNEVYKLCNDGGNKAQTAGDKT